jgi:LPXTG-motif cell wall-anchored protein
MKYSLRKSAVRAAAVVAAVFLVFFMAPLTGYADGRDISAEDISSLDVSLTTVSGGSQLKVTMNFDEDIDGALDIAEGDMIKVTWTSSGNFYFEGVQYNAVQDVVLEGTGTVIGQAVVSATDAVITFSSAVEGLQHVSGYFSFWLTAVISETDETITSGDATIQGGDFTENVTISRSDSPGPVFASKAGSFATSSDGTLDYALAQWFIVANRTFDTVTGTVTIVDRMPKGLTFAGFAYAFMATETENNLNPVGSYANTAAWITALGGTWTYSESDSSYNVLTITFPASAFTYNNETVAIAFCIETAVDETQFEIQDGNYRLLQNTMECTFTLGTDSEVNDDQPETHTANLYIPISSTGAQGVPKGIIQITKVVDGTSVPISGVTFRAYKLDGAGGTRLTGWYGGSDYVEFTTDDSGIAISPQLDDGYYEIEEASAPDWVVMTTQKITAILSGETGTAESVENSIKTTSVTAKKIWLDSDGSDDTGTHPDIWFQLCRAVDGGEAEAVEGELVKLGDGTVEVTFSDLPVSDEYGNYYTYSVEEVDSDGNSYVPDGYQKSEDGLIVTNTKIPDEQETPKTGDNSGPAAAAAFSLALGTGAVLAAWRRRKEK